MALQVKQQESEALALAQDLDAACAARAVLREQVAHLTERVGAKEQELKHLRQVLVHFFTHTHTHTHKHTVKHTHYNTHTQTFALTHIFYAVY